MRPAFVVCALVIGATLAWAQQLKPGMYEMRIEIAIPGAPQPMTMTQTACVSPDDAAGFRDLLQQQMGELQDCSFSDPVQQGDTFRWTSVCDDVTSTSEIRLSADGFTGTVASTVEGMVIDAKMSGKWLGATCSAESLGN